MKESTKCVDAKGLPCPEPVVRAKKALEEGGFEILEVIVDNETAVENVTRFATHGGHAVESVTKASGVSTIRIVPRDGAAGKGSGAGGATEAIKGDAAPVPAGSPAPGPAGIATVFISSAEIGSGNEELGALLMKGFISTLLETAPLPERIIFMNGGVKLAVEGSTSLERLATLASRGVEILSCGTCLDFYKLKDKLAVGRVTNMFEIASLLMQGSVLRV
jgi:selenium metabolism protein YedF